MTEPLALLLYINGHGFGHATRCLAVLRELWALRPQLPVVLRTDAPGFLFRKECTGPYRLLPGPVDPGTLQADPLTLDVRRSLEGRSRFQEALPGLVEEERARLTGVRVGLVLGDIPPLAFEVADALGVGSVAMGNFSWDWIYETLGDVGAGQQRLVEGMRRSYAKADLLLRLPLHGEMSAFRQVRDIAHVVRRSRGDRAALRRALGLGAERRPVVLVSFGGFAAVRYGDASRADPGPFRFVVFGEPVPGMPADTVQLPVDHPFSHEDLVASADALITKPGYGTVAECLASRTPFLYTSRDHFREYDVLVEGIRLHARAGFLPREDLLALGWRRHLEALLSADRPWPPVAVDGAAEAARHLLELFPADDPGRTVC